MTSQVKLAIAGEIAFVSALVIFGDLDSGINLALVLGVTMLTVALFLFRPKDS